MPTDFTVNGAPYIAGNPVPHAGMNLLDSAVNDIQNGLLPTTTAGTHDAQTLSSSLAALVSGAIVVFIVGSGLSNTGTTPTLNVNSLGAKTIQLNGAALSAGQLVVGNYFVAVYDGTHWQLIAANIPSSRSGSFVSLAASSNAVISNLAGLSTGTAKLTIYDNQGNIVDYVLYNGTIQQQDTNATYSASTSASPSPASLSVIIALNAGVLKIYTGASWSGFSWNFTLDLFS